MTPDEDIVDIGTAEIEITQNTIDEAQEGLGCIPKKKLKEPIGVVIAVSGATGIWWYARSRPTVEKPARP